MKPVHAMRATLLGAALLAAACSEVPARTEEARGLLEGFNLALALSVIFLVVSGALVVGAVALDRTLKARRALAEAEAAGVEEDEEEEEEVVAGIGVGRAPVPRWLYGFYIVIPLFALMYVLNAVAFAPAPTEATPEPTPPPTGPVTELTVVAQQIRFDFAEMTFPANTDVQINFDNQDAVPHNVAIYDSDALSQAIFVGDIFTGPAERTYSFTTPGVGEYYFHCDVHPSMSGDVHVVEDTGEEDTGEEAPAEEPGAEEAPEDEAAQGA